MTTKFAENSESYSVDESIGFLTGVAYRAINRRLMNNFKEAGHEITTEQFGVLVHLWNEEGLTQQEISLLTAKDKPSVSRLLNHLEKKELIVRNVRKDDKRCNKIFLTEKGKKLEEPSLKLAKKTLDEAIEDVDKGELNVCKEVLRQIQENLVSLEELCNIK